MNTINSVQPLVKPVDQQLKKPPGNDTATTTEPVAKPGNGAFSVQITEIAGQIHQSLKADEVSHDKVAAIRDQLAAGTYSISGKDVANKILKALKG